MSFSRFFVYRPVFTSMLILIVLLLGVVGLTRLPIDLVPDVTFPTLSISTTYTGAGPEEIEELITRPIEESVSSVPGADSITSVSSEGSSQVRVSFNYGTDLSEAANDIRERIDRLINRLPEDADRPRLLKFDLAGFPIVILGVESNVDPIQTRLLLDTEIKNRLERVPGVASVDALGGLEREIRVELDFYKMQSLNISLNAISRAIQDQNIQVPAGSIDQGSREILLRTPGEFKSLDDLKQAVIAYRNGVPIVLGQVATVKDTSKKVTGLVRVNGKPGIRMGVRKQSGTNTVEVASRAVKEIERINRDIRQLQLSVLVDTSDFIKRSLQNVVLAIFFGGLLSVLVLYVFLGNLRTTLVIATAIPISIIATFVLMYFFNLTLNVITLGGLALGVGMLVDNAIVVLENIFRQYDEEGQEALEAASTGSSEVGTAVLASTLTTLAVFVPLVFVQGISAVTYQRLGMVVGFALISSLVVALTLVPMLTGRVLKWGKKDIRVSTVEETDLSKGLDGFYARWLKKALNWRYMVVLGSFVILGLSLLLIPLIGVEFMPEADEGEVRISGEMEVGTRLEVVREQFEKIEDIVRKEVPETVYMLTELGATGFGGPRVSHEGQIRLYLVPSAQRKRSSAKVASDLRRALGDIPGMTIRTRPASAFFVFRRLSGGSNNDRIQVDIRGYDFDVAEKLAKEVKQKIDQIPGITDSRFSQDEGNPEVQLVVNRQRAADANISVGEVGRALQTVLSGSLAGRYRQSGRAYDIRVQMEDAEKLSLETLQDLTLINPAGQAIPLGALVSSRERLGPVSIERKEQERVITIAADSDGRPLSDVLNDIQNTLDQITLPPEFSVAIAGDIEEQTKSFNELVMGMVLSLLLVYMIMAAQYESFLYPFVVMFSVPLAAIGVILTLLLTNTTFNLQSFIGVIMLGGIVVNNAIILVDQINQLRQSGWAVAESVIEGSRRRLRPILMTSLTTTLGLLPLALGMGEGAETQAPMARTVIGGLLSSAALTLFVVPLVYYSLESLKTKWMGGPHEIHEASSNP